MPKSKQSIDSFANRLKLTREGKGLSQSELAQRAELQPSAISHFETGRREPSLANLRRVAVALGVDVDYLVAERRVPVTSSRLGERLLRTASSLSRGDQETLMVFAKMLAEKKKARSKS